MQIGQLAANENTLNPLLKSNNNNPQSLKDIELLNNNHRQQYNDVIDSTLTVRENEELSLNCIVDSSKPAAEIQFSTSSLSTENIISPLSSKILKKLQPAAVQVASSLDSMIRSDTNILQNNDRTFRSEFRASLKANANDHGKIITCKADNGFSNQKWENKKVLNILCK